MIVCSNCHAENPKEKNFCKECGTRLNVRNVVGKPAQPIKKKKRYWWLLIIVLAIIAGGAYLIQDRGMGGSVFSTKKSSYIPAGSVSDTRLIHALVATLRNQDDREFVDNFCLIRANISELNHILPEDEKFDVKAYSKKFKEFENDFIRGWNEINDKGLAAGINWGKVKIISINSDDFENNTRIKKGVHAVIQSGNQNYSVYLESCVQFESGWKVCKGLEWRGIETSSLPEPENNEEIVENQKEGIQVEDSAVEEQLDVVESSVERADSYAPPKVDKTHTEEFIPLLTPNGASFMYKGDLKLGLADGKGYGEYQDGTKYEGDYSNNVRHGEGTLSYESGVRITGTHVNDWVHGFATIYFTDGSYYAGNWVKGIRSGKGSYYWTDGGKYEGVWADNQRINGKMFFADNASYEGEWSNDKLGGNGTFIWPDGNKYVGQFKNGMRHGRGVFYWHDGQRYEGDFVENFRTGQGTYYWPDGQKYKGGFLKNQSHGEGANYNSAGEITQQGRYENGVFLGK